MLPLFHSPDFWSIVLIMVIGGTIGGVINYYFSEPSRKNPSMLRCVVVGIGAALLVPMFLFLTQSRLLDDLTSPPQPLVIDSLKNSPAPIVQRDSIQVDSMLAIKPDAPTTQQATSVKAIVPNQEAVNIMMARKTSGYLVFFSLCILAAISGFRFIPTVTSRFFDLQKQVDEAKEKIDVTAEKTEKLKEENKQTLNAVKAVSATLPTPKAQWAGKGTVGNSEQLTRDFDFNSPPADDPQKRGDPSTANGYRLTAHATPVESLADWFTIHLKVASIDPAKPLSGDVTFFLHPTFSNPVRKIPVKNGVAEEEVVAYGGFTVAAKTPDGTRLELDLAQEKNLPGTTPSFRSR